MAQSPITPRRELFVILSFLALALITRLACPNPAWAPWGLLQAGLLLAVILPVWLAAAWRSGARTAARAAITVWLFLAAALSFESIPDSSHYGVLGHTAALLFALAAIFWLRPSDAERFGLRLELGERRTRRALVIVVVTLCSLFVTGLVLLRTGVLPSGGPPPRGGFLETVIFQFVIVAIEEELVWRGFVQTHLDAALAGRVRFLGAELGWGALVSTLAFGLMHNLHVQLAPLHVEVTLQPQIVFACLFVYLRAYTGSIWPAVALHGLWNGLGNVLTHLASR